MSSPLTNASAGEARKDDEPDLNNKVEMPPKRAETLSGTVKAEAAKETSKRPQSQQDEANRVAKRARISPDESTDLPQSSDQAAPPILVDPSVADIPATPAHTFSKVEIANLSHRLVQQVLPMVEEGVKQTVQQIFGADGDGGASLNQALTPNMAELMAMMNAAPAVTLPRINFDDPPCDTDREYFNGKGAVGCPRGCPQEKTRRVDNKENRKFHYRKTHYDVYYTMVQTTRSAIVEFIEKNFGERKEGKRVCIHCTGKRRHYADHQSRLALFRHIQSDHEAKCREISTEYVEILGTNQAPDGFPLEVHSALKVEAERAKN